MNDIRSTALAAVPVSSADRLSRHGGIDSVRLERAVREILFAIGEDPDREGLVDTPRRVAKAYRELFSGLYRDPGEVLCRTFAHESKDLVTVKDIEFFSFCEHHLLPFFGRAHIAYLPADGQVVGLSKTARLVDVFARRPQLQERLTAQIADSLVEHLDPDGVTVVVRAEHLCMKARGVEKRHAEMTTVAHRGRMQESFELRTEVLGLLGFPLGGAVLP